MQSPEEPQPPYRISIVVQVSLATIDNTQSSKRFSASLTSSAIDEWAVVAVVLKHLDRAFAKWLLETKVHPSSKSPAKVVFHVHQEIPARGDGKAHVFQEKFDETMVTDHDPKNAIELIYTLARGEAAAWFRDLFRPVSTEANEPVSTEANEPGA